MSDLRDEGYTLSAPSRPDLSARTTGTWAGVTVALGLGVLVDAASRSTPGLAITAATWFAAAAVLIVVRPRRASLPFLLGAVLLGSLVSLRQSPVLIALDVLGAAALLCVGATFGLAGAPAGTSTRSYAVRGALSWFESTPDGVSALVGPFGREMGRRGSPRAIARVLLVVLPFAVALSLLFGSADPEFRRYVHVPSLDPATWSRHLGPILIGALALTTLLAIATRAPTGLDRAAALPLRVSWLRPAEWISLLAVVNALFAIFVTIQFAEFFGGSDRVLTEPGLTYAGYARGGFWQLLATAAIAGGVLALGWLALPVPTTTRLRRAYLALGLPLVALVGVVLVSAFQRLTLYERAYGFTWLRVLVHLTIIDLGLIFACVVLAWARWRASWLPSAAVAIVTLSVVALNAWNLDARIAQSELARLDQGHALDPVTLATLSDDAVPTLVDALPTLDAHSRRAVERILSCRAGAHGATGITPAGWNLSWLRADTALDLTVLPACAGVD
jgi:hypothetical protein